MEPWGMPEEIGQDKIYRDREISYINKALLLLKSD